jgi:hypothetical protein
MRPCLGTAGLNLASFIGAPRLDTTGWCVGTPDIFRYRTVDRARLLAVTDTTDKYKRIRFPIPSRSRLWILTTRRAPRQAASFCGYDLCRYGAYIMGPSGEKVGIFYSSINRLVINIDKTNKTVSLIPDTPYLRDSP